MMRKTSLLLLGAAAGAALTLISTQPQIVFNGSSAKAAAADTYRQLSLFGDVFGEQQARLIGISELVSKSQPAAILVNKARSLLYQNAA